MHLDCDIRLLVSPQRKNYSNFDSLLQSNRAFDEKYYPSMKINEMAQEHLQLRDSRTEPSDQIELRPARRPKYIRPSTAFMPFTTLIRA